MEKTEAKGSPAVGDGSEAKVGDAEEAKPSVEMESVVVQDSELMDSENMLTRDNQPEWIVRIAKRWALERGDVEELMHLLVGASLFFDGFVGFESLEHCDSWNLIELCLILFVF